MSTDSLAAKAAPSKGHGKPPAEPDAADASPGTPAAPEGATPDMLLTAALAGAQAAFPPVEKRHTATVPGRNGKTGYTYTYADLADVMSVVRPVLGQHGLAIVQRTVMEQGGRTTLVTELRHVGGGILRSDVDLGQSSASPQQFGGALTYLRRYEVCTLLGIAAEEDRDAQDVEPAGQVRTVEAPLPGWAQMIDTDDDKRAFVGSLGQLVGKDHAKTLAKTWAAACGGGIPLVVSGVIDAMAVALAPEDAAAGRDAQRQAQAGEQPDPEAPQPAPDLEPEENAPGPPAPPHGYKQWPSCKRFVTDLKFRAQQAGLPEPTGEELEQIVRHVGCRCPEPFSEPPVCSDSCVFPDHGIPF